MKCDANERIYEVTFFFFLFFSFPRLKLPYLPYLTERIYTRPIFYDSCRIAGYLVSSPVSYSDHIDRASWLWLTEVQSGWFVLSFSRYLLTYLPTYLTYLSIHLKYSVFTTYPFFSFVASSFSSSSSSSSSLLILPTLTDDNVQTSSLIHSLKLIPRIGNL